MTVFAFLLVGLAVWRAARLVAVDSITDAARDRVELWAAAGGKPSAYVADLVSCVYCVSVWIAGGTTVAWWAAGGRPPTAADAWFAWPALAAAWAAVAALAADVDAALGA